MQNLFNLIEKFNIPTEVILDIGSRDLTESVLLKKKYENSNVFSFECNPQTLPICKKNLIPGITLIDKAVNNYDGTCTFYPINPEKTQTTWADGNPGASSLFKSNGKYSVENYVQDEIQVDCVRIDTTMKKYNISKIDVVWMDLQGAELIALESFGDYLKDVSIIYTEVEINPIYENQCLFPDVLSFLKNDFEFVEGNIHVQWGTDVIFINKKMLNK